MTEQKELKIAQCCGTCIHTNKPKQPRAHEAHYCVAKTERWCYLNRYKVTRESVCDAYEMDNKKGGVPAHKRVLKFNERANRILKLVKAMQDNNIDELKITDYSEHTYVVKDGWLFEKYKVTMFGEDRISYWREDSTAKEFDEKEKYLWEALEEKLLQENN